jgi:hypothetical protein
LAIYRRNASDFPVQILIQSASDDPNRAQAFNILNSLSDRWNKFVTVRTVTLDGKEEYITSRGGVSISMATHNGNQVAVKRFRFHSGKGLPQAESVRHGIIIGLMALRTSVNSDAPTRNTSMGFNYSTTSTPYITVDRPYGFSIPVDQDGRSMARKRQSFELCSTTVGNHHQ